MSQREGSIYVCVKQPSDWEKLFDMEIKDDWWLEAATGKDLFDGIEGTEWNIDGNWSPEFGNGFVWLSGIGSFVHEIAELLGRKNCVVLASLTDIDVAPFENIYYSLGKYCEQKVVRGIRGGPSFRDIGAWLDWARIKLTADRLKHLSEFDATRGLAERIIPVTSTRKPAQPTRSSVFVSDDTNAFIIPNGAEEIGKEEYKGVAGISKVIIPDSVTVIGEHAFERCKDLEEVVFPSNLREIKKCAFYHCTKLKRVNLPDTVAAVRENAFCGCKKLKEITLGKGLKNLGRKVFKDCQSITNIDIPMGVKKLDNQLFQGCKKLSAVTYSTEITAIGEGCFADCISLNRIVLPNKLKTIDTQAFKGCENLSELEVGELPKLTDVGYELIEGTALQSQLLNNGSAFYLGNNLVFATGTNTVVRDGTKYIVFKALRKIRRLTLPASLPKIDIDHWSVSPWDYHLYPLSEYLEEVVLLPGFTSITKHAFYNCKKLKEVTIPETVTLIDDEAFVEYESIDGKLVLVDHPNLVIKGTKGTEAEEFAARKRYAFLAIE